MKIFQYFLLVNRNGVVVLTAKGILKIVTKNFTTTFVRELYVKYVFDTRAPIVFSHMHLESLSPFSQILKSFEIVLK